MMRSLRDRDWALSSAPQELAGRPEGVIFAAICVVMVGLITIVDFIAPRHGTVGAIDMLPVAAAAWLLSRRLAVLVVVVAMAASVTEAAVGLTHPLTAVAQIIVVPLLAVLGRLASTSIVQRYDLERRARHAADLERAKSDFLRLASHELRGPVAILRGYLSMLDDGSLGELAPAVRQVMPILSATATSMNGTVDHMLDLSRLEDSRLQLRRAPTDLGDLVLESAATVDLMHGGSHQVTVKAESVPTLRVDPSRVSTIVGNLVSNAIKYSPAGSEVLVEVETGAGEARVVVTDHGVGLDEDEQRLIFNRFGRVVRPETRHVMGTGLGLYLSRELARLHGGDITVDSRRGEGSTFTLHLPLPPAAKAAATPTAMGAHAQARRRHLAS